MKNKILKRLSYIYLILPIIIFFVSWLKIYIAIPLVIGLIAILYIKMKKQEDDDIEVIKTKHLLILIICVLIVCILAGLGGFFYQSDDYNWRNAIFRDLVKFDWPVFYETTNSALDYYIGFWIVPAAIAKLFLPISQNLAWGIANISQLLWATVGVVLTVLWILKTIKIKEKKKIFLVFFMFILFSGLDIVGMQLYGNYGILQDLHIERWAGSSQFSSIVTQLFWVFNQSIYSWLITWMFLDEKRTNNFMLFGLLALPYAPLPFCGIVYLFIAKGTILFVKAIKEKTLKAFFKDIFSIQNILAFICILPVYYFFYNSNSVTETNGFRFITQYLQPGKMFNIMVFWLLEVGLYFILIIDKYKKEPLFYVSFLGLLIIPFFAIGNSSDFTMRASIPLLIVCFYYIIQYVLSMKRNEEKFTIKLKNAILIALLLIGMVTPAFEFYRSISTVIKNKSINCIADNIQTIDGKDPRYFTNFICINPKQNSVFFKYISK